MAIEYKLPFTAKEIEEKLGEVVDQAYDSSSENAQSGKAVAEAISTISAKSAGQKMSDGGGEIFNDYDTNLAVADFSIAGGTQNIAGMRAFNITAISGIKGAEGTFTLDGTETPTDKRIDSITDENEYKLAVGDLYSLEFNGNYEDCGIITAIDGNVVTVDSMYLDPSTITTMPTKAYFNVMDKPFAGTTDPMGTGAQATGYGNKAGKLASFATGYNNVAGGKYSFVSGNSNRAGVYSSVSGVDNKGIGHAVLVGGMNNVVDGWYSGAVGENNTVRAQHCFGSGKGNTVYDAYWCSFVGGQSNTIGDANQTDNINNIFAHGQYNTVTATASAVFGSENKVYAKYALATGRSNEISADGTESVISGVGNKVYAADSIATGCFNEITGSCSMTAGSNNNISNTNSLAIGSNNIVSGSNSFAVGASNEVTEDNTIISGSSNKAYAPNSFAIGTGNKVSASSAKNSLLMGNSNTSNAESSFINGAYNTSAGKWSVTNGFTCYNKGQSSIVIGNGCYNGFNQNGVIGDKLISIQSNQFICGSYNDHNFDMSFAVGNGTAENVYVETTDSSPDSNKDYYYKTFSYGSSDNYAVYIKHIGNWTTEEWNSKTWYEVTTQNRQNAFVAYKDGHAEVQTVGTTDNSIVTRKFVSDYVAEAVGDIDLAEYATNENGANTILYENSIIGGGAQPLKYWLDIFAGHDVDIAHLNNGAIMSNELDLYDETNKEWYNTTSAPCTDSMISYVDDQVKNIDLSDYARNDNGVDTILIYDKPLREMLEKHDLDIDNLKNEALFYYDVVCEMPENPSIHTYDVASPYLVKTYVDDKIGDIETALDSIIEIQNSLMGGEVA